MFAKTIRLSIAIGCVIFGIIKFVQNDLYGGLALLMAGVMIAYFHFRNASIIAVASYVKRGEYDRAKKLLEETPNVKLLSKGNKGYYYWSRAYIKINENDTLDVESDFIKSLEYGLRDENDKAMANASLGEIYIHKGNNIKAIEHLDKAIELSTNDSFKKKIEKLKSSL